MKAGVPLIVRRSLRQHAVSSAITVGSVGLACGLVLAVFAIQAQSVRAFTAGPLGFDAVLGARGSQLQLVLNAVWSPVFFGAHQIVAAAVILVSLWLVLAVTTHAFFRIDRPAGWMLVPYLLWVTFASVLNIAISVLN